MAVGGCWVGFVEAAQSAFQVTAACRAILFLRTIPGSIPYTIATPTAQVTAYEPKFKDDSILHVTALKALLTSHEAGSVPAGQC